MNNKTVHQFSAGVKILLERVKTNPEEFASVGRFTLIVEDVFDSVQDSPSGRVIDKSFRVRMLTNEEIIALHEAFTVLERPKFDAWVMKEILGDEEKDTIRGLLPQQQYFAKVGQTTPSAFAQSQAQDKSNARLHAAQNAYNPYANITSSTATSYADIIRPKSKSFWSKFFNGMVGP